ncbi:MAG: DUF1045 domain-containing protein [Paracoccaceae bacterium]
MALEGYARYAVYWAPEAGSALWQAGSAWLGWDAETGQVPTRPAVALPGGLEADALTRRPRRYGFHGTLKPPFRLAEGCDVGELDAALRRLGARQPATALPSLVLDAALGFVALRPEAPSPALAGLAGAAVTELDAFRAPLTEAEIARRRTRPLDPVEETNLSRWGYPHVLDRFRFHLTLTGPVGAEGDAVAAALRPLFAPHLDGQPLREIALYGDPGVGAPFRLIHRYPLG